MRAYMQIHQAVEIDVRPTQKEHRQLLGDIQIRITPDLHAYITREEAYTLLNALEAAIHEFAQDACVHPEDEQDASAGYTTCTRCGAVLVAPTIDELS